MPATVKKGSQGNDVTTCQELLNYHGFHTGIDGIFGAQTETQVKMFQSSRGLGVDGICGPNTWDALFTSTLPVEPLPPVLARARQLGHQIWGDPYRIWLFGIRSPERIANKFDDLLGGVWFEGGLWHVRYWPGTTDPGTYWLENPSRVEGTAILKEGQYLDTWQIGLHGGAYRALVQTGNTVTVYRDNNRDEVLDLDPASAMTGWFGINIHRATSSGQSTEVNQWSAGCQVHARDDAFDEMMALADIQVNKTGRETFSYTVLDQWW